MKLKNKKTGEIGWLETYYGETDEKMIAVLDKKSEYHPYNSLAQLNEEWEDYEEPKQWYGLNAIRDVGFEPLEYEGFEDLYKHAKELGIAFDTKEEAEKAAEKLKAWKRLKDKGFRFCGGDDACISYEADIENWSMQDLQDFDLLFGGEK